MNIQSLLPIAIKAAEEASKVILAVYQSGDFEVEAKADNSPLTIADKRGHQTIMQHLESTGLPVLSEEGRSIPYSERKNWEYFWMVDPLDGTKEFLNKRPEFTVNIALIHKTKPVLGVVAVPVTGDVFYSSAGEGAYLKKNNTIKKLEIRSKIDLTKTGLRVVGSRSHMNAETESFINNLKEPNLVSAGSSLKFTLLATGEADVYPRFAPTMEWDTAAAHAIVNEAGIKVFQHLSQEELVYNKEDLLNPYFLCH